MTQKGKKKARKSKTKSRKASTGRRPGRQPGGKTVKLSNDKLIVAAKMYYGDDKKQDEVAKRFNISPSYLHKQLTDARDAKVFSIEVVKGKGFAKARKKAA